MRESFERDWRTGSVHEEYIEETFEKSQCENVNKHSNKLITVRVRN